MLCKRQTSEADDRQLMERMANVQTRVARGVMMAQKELMDALDTETPDATATATKTRRRRREADPKLTCAVVEETGQGASPWTVAQLNDMSVAEVKMCRKALGSKKADNDKLTVVWGKLKELMELAKRATSEFSGLSVDPTEYESDNLVAAGQLICGMDAANVTKIPNEKIKPAMKTLAEVQWCPTAIKEKLATKSLELNGGDAKSLGKAEVAEMGALVGGLEAMQLKDIPKDAMAGLTAEGMKSIPPSKIAVLTADQVSQLSAAAALSVSADQRANLPEDSRTALDAVLEVSVTPKDGAEQVTGALLSTLLLAFAVLRLA
ncbi:hypothetical protein FJT64_013558 [Amphibalanus amphitrite]|uniref:Uncharacterized protein n=1 Tax=Amphibalanus amphitrite TaxID=1232801 RepID=A0A6A4VCH0_AMPAM|nr:hypothetical protein FJT64_013558 [Amphibalanus amphitrite]